MNNEGLRELEQRIRAWTSRPPALSPKTARTRVLARLEGRRSRPAFSLATAALVVAVLAVGSLMLHPGKPVEPPVRTPGGGLLVYELESGTKVYLDLAARPAEGERR